MTSTASRARTVADLANMCVTGTPVDDHRELGLWVKREDLCCPGGPNFSKARGVWGHVSRRNEELIGVLDTTHSQGGWAVARACAILGRQCVVYWPKRVSEPETLVRPQQQAARDLGAELKWLPAGRSAVLYHTAKRDVVASEGYMMPNALKLPESVEETALEVGRTSLHGSRNYVVSASSATLAAGVVLGLHLIGGGATVFVHMGYSRPVASVLRYMQEMTGLVRQDHDHGTRFGSVDVQVVDEGYEYKDAARPGPDPGWPCNEFYDLKAFRWWMREGRAAWGQAMMWNIG
jgi:hypothetical protein